MYATKLTETTQSLVFGVKHIVQVQMKKLRNWVKMYLMQKYAFLT